MHSRSSDFFGLKEFPIGIVDYLPNRSHNFGISQSQKHQQISFKSSATLEIRKDMMNRTCMNNFISLPSDPRDEKLGFVESKSRRSSRSRHKVADIAKPEKTDVLCGRGRGFFEHPGNRRMLSIISQFKPEYQASSKIEKSALAQRVLKVILEPNDGSARPRFLKKAGKGKRGLSGGWLELSDKEIHRKVAHTLREHKSVVRLSKVTADEMSSSGIHSSVSTSEDEEATSLPPMIRVVSDSSVSDTNVFGREQLEKNVESNKTSSALMNAVADDKTSSSRDYQGNLIDDEQSSEHGIEKEQAMPEVTSSWTEPLSYQQELVFNEKEIDHLLHTMLDEDDAEDIILDSFLGELDFYNSTHSMCSS